MGQRRSHLSGPTLRKPNGARVTMAHVYAALYEKELADAARFTQLSGEITLLRSERLVEKQASSEAKRAGRLGAVAGLLSMCVTAVREIMGRIPL